MITGSGEKKKHQNDCREKKNSKMIIHFGERQETSM